MRCRRCNESKPAEEFPRNRNSWSGRHFHCKPCHNQQVRESRLRHGGSRHYHLRRRYGIGAAEVDALIAAQGGLCAACKQRPATQVDHDHRTGKIRGILCLNCNAALGALKDDLQTIYKAICYLDPIPMKELAE